MKHYHTLLCKQVKGEVTWTLCASVLALSALLYAREINPVVNSQDWAFTGRSLQTQLTQEKINAEKF